MGEIMYVVCGGVVMIGALSLLVVIFYSVRMEMLLSKMNALQNDNATTMAEIARKVDSHEMWLKSAQSTKASSQGQGMRRF